MLVPTPIFLNVAIRGSVFNKQMSINTATFEAVSQVLVIASLLAHDEQC